MSTQQPAKLSCGVVVIRQTPTGRLFLMLRAFSNWDFPKGMCEPGEAPKNTALREVAEETTINDLEFPWGDVSFDTGPYGHNKTSRYFLGQTKTENITLPVNPEIGRAEHHEWRWVSLDEARDLATPRVQSVLGWADKTLGTQVAGH